MSRITVLAALFAIGCAARTPPTQHAQESAMHRRATGTFDVKVTPIDPDPMRGHLRFEKQFRGDFVGASAGEMFTTGTAVEGSAGYVARERITGVLDGKRGSFAVQHLGTMRAAEAFKLQVEIVPDSGTEQLVGLSGAMKIIIEPDGTHRYELEYDLAR
jgi:hypothetical protein